MSKTNEKTYSFETKKIAAEIKVSLQSALENHFSGFITEERSKDFICGFMAGLAHCGIIAEEKDGHEES